MFFDIRSISHTFRISEISDALIFTKRVIKPICSITICLDLSALIVTWTWANFQFLNIFIWFPNFKFFNRIGPLDMLECFFLVYLKNCIRQNLYRMQYYHLKPLSALWTIGHRDLFWFFVVKQRAIRIFLCIDQFILYFNKIRFMICHGTIILFWGWGLADFTCLRNRYSCTCHLDENKSSHSGQMNIPVPNKSL